MPAFHKSGRIKKSGGKKGHKRIEQMKKQRREAKLRRKGKL